MIGLLTTYHQWRILRNEEALEKLGVKMKAAAKVMSSAESALMAKGQKLEEGYCDTGTVSTDAYHTGMAKIKKSLAKLDHKFTNLRDRFDRKVYALRRAIHKHQEALKEQQ